jgi:hypothetical protein
MIYVICDMIDMGSYLSLVHNRTSRFKARITYNV